MKRDTPPPVTTDAVADRSLYLAALAVFGVVFAGYVWTLAPTVTLWDAGELIATAKILGIPHPPGTPLFTLLGNVWAFFVPIGGFAFRTNLMTATFSAVAAAFFFLLVVHALRGASNDTAGRDPVFKVGGAVAAAMISAFAFTVWQNSNETEVYMVAALTIAATTWLAWLWRKHRGRPRAPHILLLIFYLAAVSLGNHLLALLVGPALIGFMAHVLKTEPLANERDRKIEWGQWAVLTGAWTLLIAMGLGNTNLLILGGIAFLLAAGYAATVGGVRFAATVLVIGFVGASTYLFLYLRANLGPFINEADPSTWESLWQVIQRKQYPPRSPLDNPIFPSGPGNPGRSITLIGLQMQNYLQYFDWQWANGLAPTDPVFARNTPLFTLPLVGAIPVRMPFTLLFTTLGIYGAAVLRQRDRSVFWLLIVLFVVTGPGLMGYMNFKPGYSLGWDKFANMDMHEVRERDYFFTVSFQVWGLFAGIGLAGLYRSLRSRIVLAGKKRVVVLAPSVVFGIALIPLVLNFSAASRKHGPEAEFARDFSYNLLQSAEPYGIIFTNGDNDTFPLWYLQEVEGVRRDVAVVNLSLGNTDWYIRQLRDNPVRPFEADQAPWFAEFAPESLPPQLHSMTDPEIAGLHAQLLQTSLQFSVGRIDHTYEAGIPLYVKDVLMLRLILENWARRPIYYSVTVGQGNWLQLNEYLTQEGLVLRLNVQNEPDSTRLGTGIMDVPVDVPRTDSLVSHVYRYARLFEADTLDLDPWNQNIATNMAYTLYSLGQAYALNGDAERSLEHFRRAFHLSPFPQLAPMLEAAGQLPVVGGDTPIGR